MLVFMTYFRTLPETTLFESRFVVEALKKRKKNQNLECDLFFKSRFTLDADQALHTLNTRKRHLHIVR